MSLYASRNQTWTNTVIIQCYWNLTAFQIGCNTNQSSVCVIVEQPKTTPPDDPLPQLIQ